MKKMVLAILLIVGLTACDGITDTNTFPLVQPKAEYEIDTWGYNSEVYEFDTLTPPYRSCVMVMLDSGKAMGLQCELKGEKNEL